MEIIKGDLIKIPELWEKNKVIYEVFLVSTYAGAPVYLIDLSDDYVNIYDYGWVFPGMFFIRIYPTGIPSELEYLRGRYCRWIRSYDDPEKVGHID